MMIYEYSIRLGSRVVPYDELVIPLSVISRESLARLCLEDGDLALLTAKSFRDKPSRREGTVHFLTAKGKGTPVPSLLQQYI